MSFGLKQVPSFKTSDEKLFTDRGEATRHEFKIAIRGFIQRDYRATAVTPTQVADAMSSDSGFEEIYNLFKDYSRTMATINNPRTKKKSEDVLQVVNG